MPHHSAPSAPVGRYDNLASQGNRKYPGVGLSIGLSRLVSYMLHTAGAHANRVSPAAVLRRCVE